MRAVCTTLRAVPRLHHRGHSLSMGTIGKYKRQFADQLYAGVTALNVSMYTLPGA